MNNNEIQLIAQQLKTSFEGEPWFGRNMMDILSQVNPEKANDRPSAYSHSLMQLLYHVINWRKFTISRLQKDRTVDVAFFEENAWLSFETASVYDWTEGLDLLRSTQRELLQLLGNATDEILEEKVGDRQYNFLELLFGIVQHDIYHNGQFAYLIKLLKG